MNQIFQKLSAILDSVPQVPQAWANHFIYGGALGGIACGVALSGHYGARGAWAFGTLCVVGIAGLKKFADTLPPKSEPLALCVGKTLVTALMPALFYGATFIK